MRRISMERCNEGESMSSSRGSETASYHTWFTHMKLTHSAALALV
jgi:hypothetical protein